jgi:hypothetical protein
MQFKDLIQRLRTYLDNRFNRLSYNSQITNNQVDKWAIWWKTNKEEYMNILSILLFKRIEIGIDKVEEKGYRLGLDEFRKLMTSCENEYDNKTREENKKIKIELDRRDKLSRSKIV